MAALDRGVLELTADVDGDGGDETGAFHLVGNVSISQEIQKDYLVDNTSPNLVQATNIIPGVDVINRQGAYEDVGAGQHIFEIEFIGWDGATDGNGDPVPWGDGSGTFPADATQDEPFRQLQCFNRYLQLSQPDSFDPATLHIGEYSDGTHGDDGAFAPLNVTVQGPRGTHTAEDFSTFSGTFTALEVVKLDQPIDLAERIKRAASEESE